MTDNNYVATLGELYSFPGASPINADRHASQVALSERGDSWYGNVKRSDAIAFANAYTMPNSARRFYESLTEDLPVFTTATKRRVRNRREYGDVVSDYAAFEVFRHGLSRDTRFWSDQYRKERRRHGVVSIGINTATSAAQDQSQLEMRGAAALALCDYLEALGYRVALWALMGSNHDGRKHNSAVELKPANGLMSENGMAFCCHLGIWRHFYLEYLAAKPWDVSWGYGSPKDYTGDVDVDVTVPIRVSTTADATKWLGETITRLRERGE